MDGIDGECPDRPGDFAAIEGFEVEDGASEDASIDATDGAPASVDRLTVAVDCITHGTRDDGDQLRVPS